MNWKEELGYNLTKAEDVAPLLGLTDSQTEQMGEILDRFPMTISRYYYSLIDKGDPEGDPISRMSIPSISETDMSGAFDTSGEADNTVLPGMQHKYRQTVMILSTHHCAMYCRHCFRKRLVGRSDEETVDNIEEMADYVRAHKEVSNVLISGGDSFLNSNQVIEKYLDLFSQIEHLDLIRFGTRIPVVMPMRIYDDPELLAMLRHYNLKKQIYIVTQFNHPKELTAEAKKAVRVLLEAGIVVRNQAVLLKGINDDGETMGQLLKQLTACGILPYYIFQCRPVSGVKGQFQVSLKKGCEIIEAAKRMQNGQGKSIRYCLSHVTGKIEILGTLSDGEMLFKYQQAKDDADQGRIFKAPLAEGQAWL